MGIIYKVTNKYNNKVYIGKTIQKFYKRKSKHFSDTKLKSYNSKFHRAINKYGKDNFKWEIIHECVNESHLNLIEKFYIIYYDSINNGYNITNGGEGASGRVFSNETRIKLRNINLDNHNTKSYNDFIGVYYLKNKKVNPWKRVWQSTISYMGYRTSLGYFEDPVSASIVYGLVKEEIYKELENGRNK